MSGTGSPSPAVSKRISSAQPEGRGGALLQLARRLFSLSLGSPSAASGCLSCGACCEHFGGHLRASRGDLRRWQAEGRSDLLSRVNQLGWIWVDPVSGKPLKGCPFLERTDPDSAHCRIHHTKPEMCRAYPTLAHGRQCVRGITVH